MKRYIFLLLLLTGCGTKYKFSSPQYIDSAFKPLLACFKSNYSGPFPSKLGITFDVTLPSVGNCNDYGPNSDKRDITINPNDWADATPFEREFILYHELGHCVADLVHDDTVFNFMNTDVPIDETIREFREDLYLDMFGEGYELCELEESEGA